MRSPVTSALDEERKQIAVNHERDTSPAISLVLVRRGTRITFLRQSVSAVHERIQTWQNLEQQKDRLSYRCNQKKKQDMSQKYARRTIGFLFWGWSLASRRIYPIWKECCTRLLRLNRTKSVAIPPAPAVVEKSTRNAAGKLMPTSN